MDKKSYMKKLLSVLMAVAVAVTFVPLLGDSAFAGEPQDPEMPEIEVELDDADGLVEGIEVEGEEKDASAPTSDPKGNESKAVDITENDTNAIDITPEDVAVDVASAEEASTPDDGAADLGDDSVVQLDLPLLGKKSSGMGVKDNSTTNLRPKAAYFSGTITQSGNTATVTCAMTDYYAKYFRFDGLYVDDTTEIFVNNKSVTGTSVNTNIDMSNFNTGYHTVLMHVACSYGSFTYTNTDGVKVTAHKDERIDVIGKMYVSSNTITSRPNYGGRFTVYSNYLNIAPFSLGGGNYNMMSLYNQPRVYLEYSGNRGASWQRSGYMQYNPVTTITNQVYKIGGLAPNTTYLTRLRYGVNTYYDEYYGGDGKYYMFYGPVLNTTTIKTGKATKPKIKKVTAKAVNVKYHKKYRPGYYYWTGYHYVWIKGTKMRYYTYNVKVTVKLKKKPGTAGIFVNGRFLKGNKKKYTTKFKIPSPHNMSVKKPKGHIKYKVTIQSGQSASYGGYSPAWSKKKKLK